MKVKDIIICALKKLNLFSVAEKLDRGEAMDGYETETVATLTYCYNAVEDELARRYLPLPATARFAERRVGFDDFPHIPVRIRRVTAGGAAVKFSVTATHLTAEADDICVEYFYAPYRKNIDGLCECAKCAGEDLLAYGAAAEFCLINGEAEAADMFENKYRQAVDAAQSRLRGCGRIPPRSWV